jgi:hypothetical protein
MWEITMGRFREFMERHFTAVAFGEGGCHETAIQIMGNKPLRERISLKDIFAAVAFAEEGYPDMALEFLRKGPNPEKKEAEDFASILRLRGVRVWYGWAQI